MNLSLDPLDQRMVAVTDRHSAYFTLNFLNHQVCVGHLLRELQYLNELDTKQQWSRDVESLLQQAVHERNENPQTVIDKQPWLKKLDRLLTENLEHMAKQFEQLWERAYQVQGLHLQLP